MKELLAALPIIVPVFLGAAVFGMKARSAEGLDRRKYTVGAVMLVICGVGVGLIAATLIAAGPPN